MTPALVVVPVLVATFAIALNAFLRPHDASASSAWGEPLDRPRDLARIASAYRARPARPAHVLGDRTWKDLGLDAIFARVDRCLTSAGQLALYRFLREPPLDAALVHARDARARAFLDDAPLRESARRALDPLTKASVLSIAPLLYGHPPRAPRGTRLLPLVTLAFLASGLASLVWPVALAAVVACAATSIAIRFLLHGAMSAHAGALAALVPLILAASGLARLDHPALRKDVHALRETLSAVRGYRRSIDWLTLDAAGVNELLATAVTYLNVFLLLDVYAFARSVALVRGHAGQLAAMLEVAGEIDAARSIASYRAGTQTTTPVFTPRGSPVHVEGLVHPLVEDAVPNDLRLDPASGWLVLGSNMSGKSTFLRATALAACLAQSLGCVPARSYRAPLLRVQTLMQVEDDVLRGKSHFFAEALAAREMLEGGHDEADRLVVIDELFRGTNTADRVAAAGAFLRALSRGGASVLAATHDAELVKILAGDYLPHYFEEKVVGSALVFDHQLRAGPVAPRNALAVLRLVGFPEGVLAEAAGLLG